MRTHGHPMRMGVGIVRYSARQTVQETASNREHTRAFWLHLGVFLIALGTLMLEILLTRIFSVTTWYHFAFVAVSIAMFGLTAGAVLVYVRPLWFPRSRMPWLLSAGALAFSGAVLLSWTAQLIPLSGAIAIGNLARLSAAFTLLSLPFFFGGIVVCLALTRQPERTGSLYGADLAGGGLGCIALLATLELTDGPTAVIVVSAVAALAATSFAITAGGRILGVTAAWAIVTVAGAITHGYFVEIGRPLLHITRVKGRIEAPPIYETWNSFSRVTVGRPYGSEPSAPFGWGFGADCPGKTRIRQLGLWIDGVAGTVITEHDGDIGKLRYLECDVTNVVHHLRRAGDVLVIGTAGGRDVLSALLFDQRSVTGVELNGAILETVNGVFGDFSGHLDRHPRVDLVQDEARSWLARSGRKFDVIQVSLTDTWAATAAGAYVLAENGLYTREAWTSILRHLKPDGVLSVSRWFSLEHPGEVERAVSLAFRALTDLDVERPIEHMAAGRSCRRYTARLSAGARAERRGDSRRRRITIWLRARVEPEREAKRRPHRSRRRTRIAAGHARCALRSFASHGRPPLLLQQPLVCGRAGSRHLAR